MTCPKCGKEVRDGAKFCGYCGTSLRDISAPTQTVSNLDSRRFLPIVHAVILMLLTVAAFALFQMYRGGSASIPSAGYAVVYDDDGNGSLISLNGNYDPHPLGLFALDVPPEIVFSPDGKYVFFYTTRSEGQGCQLFRAECSKLTTDLKKNQTLFTAVSSGRYYDRLQPLENGKLLISGSNSADGFHLIYFDGKTTTRLNGYNYFYATVRGEKLVHSDGSTIWSCSLDDPLTSTQIDSNVDFVYFYNDDTILYAKGDDIYCISSDLKPQLLLENTTVLDRYYNPYTLLCSTETGGQTALYRIANDTVFSIAGNVSGYEVIESDDFPALLAYLSPEITDSSIGYYNLNTGDSFLLTAAALDSLTNQISDTSDDMILYTTVSYLYVAIGSDLFASKLENGVTGNFVLVSSNASPIGYVGDILYCIDHSIDYSNYYSSDFPDLYAVQNASILPVLQNISLYTLEFFDDGTASAMVNTEQGTHDIFIKSPGRDALNLGEDAYGITYLENGDLLYSDSNALWLYAGDSTTKIFDNPAYFWCSEHQDSTSTLSVYD